MLYKEYGEGSVGSYIKQSVSNKHCRLSEGLRFGEVAY